MNDSNNPYEFSDDIDADLWNQSHTGTLNGQMPSFSDTVRSGEQFEGTPKGMECPECGRIHEVPDGFDQLPRQLTAILSRFFERFDAGNVTSLRAGAPPEGLRLIAAVVNFARDVKGRGHGSPLLLAMAEVLDEMSEGKVKTRFELYLAEHRLLNAHVILKSLNGFHESLLANKNAVGDARPPDEIFAVCGHMLAFYQEQVDLGVKEYTTKCTEQGVTPNESLLKNGRYEKVEDEDGFFHHYALISSIEHDG